MLITLCYLYLWARWGPRSAALVRSTVRRLHRSRCSFTFCARQPHPDERVCLRVGGKVFCTGEAQFLDDLSRWRGLLVAPFPPPEGLLPAEHIAFVTESVAARPQDGLRGPDSSKEIVKWSEFCSPLAYKAGEPFQFMAAASVDNFSSLGIAFLEDRLRMENGMVPRRIVSVHLEESALKELAKQRKEEEESPDMDAVTPAGKSGLGKAEEDKSRLEEEREDGGTGGGEQHHLHLSSCHECLQLESSTIESVKFASDENTPELPQGCSSAGQDKERQNLQKGVRRINLAGKAPNILIYLGSEAAEGRLEQVKAVLRECVGAESYALYQLRQERVLRDPWLENCLLLLIATEEPLPEAVHGQFVAFLAKGGKILGLSSSFAFGGVRIKRKDELRRVVHELVVCRQGGGEARLSLLLSGCVFEEGTKGDGSRVKVLGRLSSAAEDAVMVRLSHGSGAGEAILCQAHLELDSSAMDVQTEEDFNLLKMSNPKRFEVLREVLTCLGLSCERSEIPELTPIFLLSPDEEIHLAFLKWLEGNVDAEGLRASSKVSLKFVPSREPRVEVTPSLVPVVTEMGSFSSEHFSLHTYQQHLRTKKLGKVLLFTEVTTTTMNLLDG
ncbi:biotin--protein ligase-like [Melozone crissalis]|uniref:biotin--protein ligase-like n=1 Tax=Melozone crissalis TaxID=40204 RepID=UPI0023DC48C2|nr:biotin--protein ligase-like [Melozone crissalis]